MGKRRRNGTPTFRVGESATVIEHTVDSTTQVSITETVTGRLFEPAGDGAGVRRRVLLITPGWGATGYYSREVLQQAGRDRVWPAGTHMYLDHPTDTEETERPERSVRDLAAVLEDNATWDARSGGLVATARVFGEHAPAINEKADAIGVSIRALATGHHGEADGRTGMIIDKLERGISVDFVTRAGRGGRVMEVLESAGEAREARNVGQWFEARLHLAFTELADHMYGDGRLTRDERIALSTGIGNALTAFTAHLETNVPQLYQRDLWDEPQATPVAAAAAETSTSTSTTGTTGGGETPPASSASLTTEESMSHPTGQAPASNPVTTGQNSTPAAGGPDTTPTPTTATEAQLALARSERDAAESRAQALAAAQRQREAAEAREAQALAEVRQLRADNTAREQITTALDESNVPAHVRPLLVPRISDRVIGRVPLTESGEVDGDALTAQITAAIEAESTYAAALLEAQGVGSVRGLGSTGTQGPSEADLEKQLAGAFSSLGLSESAATRAAKGRM
jgi:hypothetical protein